MPRVLRETPILRVVPKASVEQGMEAALELALSQWQYHEELWARNVKNAKNRCSLLWGWCVTPALFGGIVPRKASAHLRDLLTQTETLMLSDVSAQTAIYSPQNASAKLALTEFLVTRGWRIFLDAKGQTKIAENFKRFADIHLSVTRPSCEPPSRIRWAISMAISFPARRVTSTACCCCQVRMRA